MAGITEKYMLCTHSKTSASTPRNNPGLVVGPLLLSLYFCESSLSWSFVQFIMFPRGIAMTFKLNRLLSYFKIDS